MKFVTRIMSGMILFHVLDNMAGSNVSVSDPEFTKTMSAPTLRKDTGKLVDQLQCKQSLLVIECCAWYIPVLKYRCCFKNRLSIFAFCLASPQFYIAFFLLIRLANRWDQVFKANRLTITTPRP